MNESLLKQWDPGVPLPPFDPMGLPAPPVLILVLAYLTFTLHLLAVNFTLGSVILTLWTRRRTDAAHAGIARFLGTAAPLGFSYLVTFGIPPLLFVQLIYGQFFYTSSVLVGAFWIAVIPLLILAHSALYVHRMTRDRRPRAQGLMLATTLVGMLAIGFIYVNNLTLAMTPGRWLEMVAAHPGGATLNLAEPTVFPRYLMFLSLSPAVAGVVLLMRGGWLRAREGPGEAAAAASGLGLRAVLAGVGLWVAGVAAWLATLPGAVRDLVLGEGPWAVVGVAAFVLVAGSVPVAVRASRATGVRWPTGVAVSLTLAFACVLVVRDQVRMAYLRDYFSLSEVPVHPQWGMLAIFGATLVAGLVFTGVLVARVAGRALAKDTGGVP